MTISFPDHTLVGVVAARVFERTANLEFTRVEAVWKFDASAQRFLGWVGIVDAPVDFQEVNRLDVVYICITKPGFLMQPPLLRCGERALNRERNAQALPPSSCGIPPVGGLTGASRTEVVVRSSVANLLHFRSWFDKLTTNGGRRTLLTAFSTPWSPERNLTSAEPGTVSSAAGSAVPSS